MKLIWQTALLGLVFACPLAAQEAPGGPWSVRLGVGQVAFHEKAEISLGGAPLFEAGATASDRKSVV